MPQPTRVALALGAGGARGYAHIGVIQVLEERGYDIVSVAGSSMGAAVGGLYAAGALPEYTDWVRRLTQRDVLRLLDPKIKAPGAIRAEKIMLRVSDLLHGARIEDLPIAYTAVATDLLAHREVWFQRGPVDVAVRASIALPSFITPVMLNGRLLADGGLLNPVPIAPTAAAQADLTIAVGLSGDGAASVLPAATMRPAASVDRSTGAPAVPTATGVPPAPQRVSAEPAPPEEWFDRFRRAAAGVLDRDLVRMVIHRFSNGRPAAPIASAPIAAEQGVEDVFGELPAGLRMFDVMQLSLEAMQSLVADYRLAGYPADVYIAVPKNSARVLDFHRADELIALGRELAIAALDGTAPRHGLRDAGAAPAAALSVGLDGPLEGGFPDVAGLTTAAEQRDRRRRQAE